MKNLLLLLCLFSFEAAAQSQNAEELIFNPATKNFAAHFKGGSFKDIPYSEYQSFTATVAGTVVCSYTAIRVGHQYSGSLACGGTVGGGIGALAVSIVGAGAPTSLNILNNFLCNCRVGGVQEICGLNIFSSGGGIRVDLTRANGANWPASTVLNYLGDPYNASVNSRCNWVFNDLP